MTFLAWRTADLSRAKDIPPLKSLLKQLQPKKRRQTPEQIMAAMDALVLRTGGKLEETV